MDKQETQGSVPISEWAETAATVAAGEGGGSDKEEDGFAEKEGFQDAEEEGSGELCGGREGEWEGGRKGNEKWKDEKVGNMQYLMAGCTTAEILDFSA